MLRIFIAYVAVLIALAVFSQREPGVPVREGSAPRRTLFWIHVVVGVLLTVYDVFHAVGHFPVASLASQVTGLAMLFLLMGELCLGFVMYFGRRPGLKAAHIAIAFAILVLLVVHFMVRPL